MADTGRTVAILLATWNGGRFLEAQLDSLAAQTHPAIDVYASDDGSTDDTIAILRRRRETWRKGRFELLQGPREGFAENFRALIVETDGAAPYVAFCDQDDLWEPDKLSRALAWLGEAGTPRLFCSRTSTMSEAGEIIGLSPLFPRLPSFRNALVQSLAGGNTMVLNAAAHALVARASARSGFVSHDWWAYLLVTGAGGAVHYCADPLVRYRQHGGNQVGANTSAAARLDRLRRLVRGQFARWTDRNMAGLAANVDLLSPDALAAYRAFAAARAGGLPARLRGLRQAGVYRQTRPGTVGLYLAALLGQL